MAYYKISVTDIISRETWFIQKRFSELRAIHLELVEANIGTK